MLGFLEASKGLLAAVLSLSGPECCLGVWDAVLGGLWDLELFT